MNLDSLCGAYSFEEIPLLDSGVKVFKICLHEELDIILYRVLPPNGSILFDMGVYGNARKYFTNITLQFERDDIISSFFSVFLKEFSNELGFGVYEGPERIDIYSHSNPKIVKYFEGQLLQFESPYIPVLYEEIMSDFQSVRDFVSTADLITLVDLVKNPQDFLFSPSFRYFLPRLLNLQPANGNEEKCILWIKLIDKLLFPGFYMLLKISQEDVNPLTGDKIKLDKLIHSRYFADTSIVKELITVEKRLTSKYPVILEGLKGG